MAIGVLTRTQMHGLPPSGGETLQGEKGEYRLTYNGNREPYGFLARDDTDALRQMCRRLGIMYPPNPVSFKARGGQALWRVNPREMIFPRGLAVAVRAGVARLYPEERRPIRIGRRK